MDVLGLILVCSMYPDEHLVRAMVDASSQGNQYFVADLATLVTFDKTSTPADARTLVTEIQKQGGRPLVGLLGLPPDWVSKAARAGSKTDLFDACTNLRIGTTVLSEHYDTCLRTHSAKVPPATKSAAPAAAASAAGTAATAASDRRRGQRVAPPEAIRACALRRFGADLGFDGYAEAVLGYLPRQRVLFAPSGFSATAPAADEPGAPACKCEEPPVRTVRRRTTRGERTSEVFITPGGAPIID